MQNVELYLVTTLKLGGPNDPCAGVVDINHVTFLLAQRRAKLNREICLIAMRTILHNKTNSDDLPKNYSIGPNKLLRWFAKQQFLRIAVFAIVGPLFGSKSAATLDAGPCTNCFQPARHMGFVIQRLLLPFPQ